MVKNNTKILKQANQYLVLQCITTYGPITIEDIVKRTNLSRPTVLNAVKELSADNVVMKCGQAESTGGRSATLLRTNGDAYFAIGIDFEFPKVRIALANLQGTIVASEEYVYPLEATAPEVLELLSDKIAAFIERVSVKQKEIQGIGLGLPGIVDVNNGKSKHIERIIDWKEVDIKTILEEKLGLPVYIRNDVHLLGLVEQRFHLGGIGSDFIYIGLRSGIGSAVFINDAIYEGRNGNAGFIGHMTVDVGGPEGVGGSRGSLNALAGELSLLQRYRATHIAAGSPPEGLPQRLEELLELAAEGDLLSTQMLEEAGMYLGIAISNLIGMLEIATIIIGGCPNLDGSVLLKSIQRTVNDRLNHGFDRVVIHPGQLQEVAYPLGGCYLVFDHIFYKPQLNLEV